ncbi:MAG: hypothetical protein VXW96_02545 [Bacteroidota bacterium]|nr:hypothetical protein [Bacteroidota bacterium]
MKSFLIKYHNHFSVILIIGIAIGTIVPDETANENYVAGIIYVIAAFCGLFSLVGSILGYSTTKKQEE